MNYFKVMSMFFGVMMILTRPVMHLIPEKWNDFELNKAYTEKQPKWLWFVGIFNILLVLFTWYKHFTTNISNSIYLTIFITLTVIKTSQLLFNYNNFRKWVVRVLREDRKQLIIINIITTILGIILIVASIYVY